jgi:hypothetical protein
MGKGRNRNHTFSRRIKIVGEMADFFLEQCDPWDDDRVDEVRFEGIKILHMTKKARLIDFGGNDKRWVPKSESRIERGVLIVPDWLADKLSYEKPDPLAGFEAE